MTLASRVERVGWIDKAREIDVNDVLPSIGAIKASKGGWTPCPACGARERSGSDRRGPVSKLTMNNGWTCFACGITGDVPALVARATIGKKLAESTHEEIETVRKWFVSAGMIPDDGDPGIQLPPPESRKKREAKVTTRKPIDASGLLVPVGNVHDYDHMGLKAAKAEAIRDMRRGIGRKFDSSEASYPDPSELSRFWSSCRPISEAVKDDADIAAFVDSRGWDRAALEACSSFMVVTPRETEYADWPAWWPSKRSRVWRLAVPAYSSDGTMRSMHARSTVKISGQYAKTLWPKERDCAGLIMADEAGREMMAGRLRKVDRVIITEGLTDLCATSMAKSSLPGVTAVLSCTNGGFGALAGASIPPSARVYAAVDEDATGDGYAFQIAEALSPMQIKRIRPSGGRKK
jgi:hypothetical protein